MLTAAVFAVACSSTTTGTSFPPPTGIVVRAETLTADRGCGTDTGQLYKYVVLVYGYAEGDKTARESYTRALSSNTFDCFADGVFLSLPDSDATPTATPDASDITAESSRFKLRVFAYNKSAYDAALTLIDEARVLGRTRTPAALDRLGSFSGELERGSAPTWTAECGATQEANVQALAVCEPLASGLAGLNRAGRLSGLE
jgi:hypothetical protein